MKTISYKAGTLRYGMGKKSLAAAVALMLVAGSTGAVFAAPAEIFAAETKTAKSMFTVNTPKEEVIYGNLAADGSVEEVNAVNIFDLSEKTKVVDYGSYSSVRNMNTVDKIKKKDDKVTVTADKGRLYYEGSMKTSELPWDVSITYYINGARVDADKLAGKSGALRIHTEIKKNANCDVSFYDGFALQATYSFDAVKCLNFKTDGATEANVGGQKQFTYTIFPGKGADLELTVDVTDFEMDAIQINGVRMDMDLDVDSSSFDGKISQITDAVANVDDGACSLSDGASALHEATGMLADKTDDLVAGSSQLSSGAADLSGGLSDLSGKGSDLNAGAEETYGKLCQSAASQINSMLTAAGMSSISLTPSTYAKTLTALSAQLSANGQSEAASQIQQVKASLDQYGEFYSGLKSYTEGVDNAVSGAASLQKKLETIQKGASSLKMGVQQLDQAAGKLATGAVQLKSGTSQFRQKTSSLDTQISDVVDEMVSSVTGKDVAVKSFVSSKNTEINSVQFVLKTETIKK